MRDSSARGRWAPRRRRQPRSTHTQGAPWRTRPPSRHPESADRRRSARCGRSAHSSATRAAHTHNRKHPHSWGARAWGSRRPHPVHRDGQRLARRTPGARRSQARARTPTITTDAGLQQLRRASGAALQATNPGREAQRGRGFVTHAASCSFTLSSCASGTSTARIAPAAFRIRSPAAATALVGCFWSPARAHVAT